MIHVTRIVNEMDLGGGSYYQALVLSNGDVECSIRISDAALQEFMSTFELSLHNSDNDEGAKPSAPAQRPARQRRSPAAAKQQQQRVSPQPVPGGLSSAIATARQGSAPASLWNPGAWSTGRSSIQLAGNEEENE